MARSYEQYHEEEKSTLANAFEQANPSYWSALQGRLADMERVSEIARHTNDTRTVVEEMYQDERQDRVARTAVEVWTERSKHAPYLPETVRAHLLNDSSILEEARKRVDEHHQNDLQAIDANEKDAATRVARGEHLRSKTAKPEEIADMSVQEKQTHFKAELHRIIDDSAEARRQVGYLMHSERERMLEEAKQNGSDDPQQTVKAFQRRMYDDVQDKLHKDIHALCGRYGYDSDHKQVQFLAELHEDEIENKALDETTDQLRDDDQELDAAAQEESADDFGVEEHSTVSAEDQDDEQGQ